MNNNLSLTNPITFEQVFALAQQLHPIEQARLVARLAARVEDLLEQTDPTTRPTSPLLRGILTDLGQAPSSEDIDEARREMWASFAE